MAITKSQRPNAQLEIMECAGHNPQMERPAEVIQVIKRFLGTAVARAKELVAQQQPSHG